MSGKKVIITLTLQIEGDDADKANGVVGNLLDEGVIQDRIAEAADDLGYNFEIVTALNRAQSFVPHARAASPSKPNPPPPAATDGGG